MHLNIRTSIRALAWGGLAVLLVIVFIWGMKNPKPVEPVATVGQGTVTPAASSSSPAVKLPDNMPVIEPTVGTLGSVVKLPDNVPVIEPALSAGTLVSADWTLFSDLNRVHSIAIDRQGYVWSSGNGGVVRWDPADGTYATYTIKNGLKQNESPLLAAAPDGAMWLLTSRYLSRFSGGSWTSYESPFSWNGHTLAVTPNGDVWIGTNGPVGGDGLYRFNGHDWSHFTTEQGLTGDDVYAVSVTSKGDVLADLGVDVMRFDGQHWTDLGGSAGDLMSVAPDGAVWLSDGRQVNRFDGTGWRTYSIPEGYTAAAIAAASGNVLWIGMDKCVARFDGTAWTTYTTVDGLAGGYINTIIADPQGGVWAGSERGLSHFDGTSWRVYRVEGFAGDVNDIAAAANGNVWFGTDNGASRFDGHSWHTYTAADGLSDDLIWTVTAASDGLVWLNPNGGLSSFDGTNWTYYRQVNLSASSLAASSGGVVWLATQASGIVYRFDGKKLDSYTAGVGPVYDIAVAPDGVAWFGSDRGVSRFDGKNWVSYLDDVFETSVVTVAVAPDGTLWCGGYGRYAYLARFDGKTWTIYKLPGPYSYIDSISVSPDGDLWVLVDADEETGGVITLIKSLAIHFTHGDWTSYDLNGLGMGKGYQIVAASDGSVWIRTNDEVMRINVR